MFDRIIRVKERSLICTMIITDDQTENAIKCHAGSTSRAKTADYSSAHEHYAVSLNFSYRRINFSVMILHFSNLKAI